ncbi:MAG: DUF6988 family protein [Methylobacter sp.]
MVDIDELDRVIARSEEFEDELFQLLQSSSFTNNNKSTAILAMYNIAQEHAVSLRELTRLRLLTSAMGILRLQYEAVVKAIWLLYAASDSAIEKLVAPLTPESEQIANNSLPSFSNMMKEIEKRGAPGVHRHLIGFKDNSWRPLNSFVHSGIHAVNRNKDGYPIALLYSAIRQSNNLTHMSAIALAYLLGNDDLTISVALIYKKYADCLQLE